MVLNVTTQAAVELWRHLSPLRVRRKRLGLTQMRLFEMTGVTHTTICSWERGRIQSPNYDTVLKFAKALCMSPERLWLEVRGWLDGRPTDTTAQHFLETLSKKNRKKKAKEEPEPEEEAEDE